MYLTSPFFPNHRGSFAVIASIFFTTAAAVGVSWALQYDLAYELFLLALVGVVLVAPVLFTHHLRADLLSPAVICSGLYFVYLVISPAYDLITGDTTFLGRDLRDIYATGIWYGLFISLSFWVGYFLPAGRLLGQALRFPQAPERFGRGYAGFLVISALAGLLLWARLAGAPIAGFFLPGVITTVDSFGASSSDGGNNYLFSMVELFVPGVLMAWRFGWKRKWVFAAAGCAVIVYTSMGFRYRLIVLGLGGVVLAAKWLRKRIRLWQLVVVLMLTSLMLVWVVENRNEIRAAGAGRVSVVEAKLPGGKDFVNRVFRDMKLFPTFLAVIDAVPSRIDFDYGATIAYTLVRAVPRELWPAKPPPPLGAIITGSIGTHEALTAGAAFPNFGEYYIALGVPSLILGMVLFGLGVRTLYEWLRAHPDNPYVQVAYAISTALLVQIISRGYTAQMVHHWAFLVLPVLGVGVLHHFIRRVTSP